MSLPLPPNLFAACPAPLGETFKAWQHGERTNDDLQEASRYFSLDHLEDFAPQVLPTPPLEVSRYRQLPVEQRKQLSAEERREYYATWDWFLKREAEVKWRNVANALWLAELLVWAIAKQLPETVRVRIRLVTMRHDEGQPAVTEWHDDGRAGT